jgi:hypothetical protein
MSTGHSIRRAHNFKDLTGQRFGSLVVTSMGERRGKVLYWNVLCDCGATNLVAGNNLTSGGSSRCGFRCPLRIDPRMKDETGNVYGKLTVLGYAGKSLKSHKGAYWNCRCECGVELVVVGVTLRNGATRSCSAGCGITTHGHTTNAASRRSREYGCWQDMKARCYKPNHQLFKNYGARQISVCVRWLESFENFFEDMGPKPFPEASIGRIDNDGNYEPSNVRWETYEQQHNNKRTSHYLTHDGITLTIAQWARRIGMHPNTLSERLSKGWSVEKALTTPTMHKFNPHK